MYIISRYGSKFPFVNVNLVPYVGPIIAILPALIIVMMIIQLAEGKFISPQVMGKKLDIHPIIIILMYQALEIAKVNLAEIKKLIGYERER